MKRSPRLRRSFPHGLVFAFAFLFAAPLLALPRDVQVSFRATNGTGQAKTDLDITYSSDTKMTVAALTVAVAPVALPQPTYTITGNGTTTVLVRFEGTFPPGAVVDVTITLRQEEKNRVRIESKWTPPGSPDDIPVPGFEVDARGVYTLFNDSPFDIRISRPIVQRNAPRRANEQLAADLFEAGSGPAQRRRLTIPAKGRLKVGRFRTRTGAFLYARFEAVFLPTDGAKPPGSTAVVVHGHEGIAAGGS
jgi:hypothetical protein